MTKRTVSKPRTISLSLDSLRRVAGGELEATSTKKPYQLTYKFAPEMLKYESGSGAQLS